MEKANFSQLELFRQNKSDADFRVHRGSAFFNNIRKYEKTILLIIGFIITGIISFSLGVENGKSQVAAKIDSHMDIALKSEPSEKRVVFRPLEKQEGIRNEQVQPKEYIENYTIQVASFQTKTSAQREIEVLKKKGLNTKVLSKSGYTILCVGNFSNKEKATSLLSQLKKQYRDCFIRRL
jgi:cell division protein FtsN